MGEKIHKYLYKIFKPLENKNKWNLDYYKVQVWGKEGKRLKESRVGSEELTGANCVGAKGCEWASVTRRWERRVQIRGKIGRLKVLNG